MLLQAYYDRIFHTRSTVTNSNILLFTPYVNYLYIIYSYTVVIYNHTTYRNGDRLAASLPPSNMMLTLVTIILLVLLSCMLP